MKQKLSHLTSSAYRSSKWFGWRHSQAIGQILDKPQFRINTANQKNNAELQINKPSLEQFLRLANLVTELKMLQYQKRYSEKEAKLYEQSFAEITGLCRWILKTDPGAYACLLDMCFHSYPDMFQVLQAMEEGVSDNKELEAIYFGALGQVSMRGDQFPNSKKVNKHNKRMKAGWLVMTLLLSLTVALTQLDIHLPELDPDKKEQEDKSDEKKDNLNSYDKWSDGDASFDRSQRYHSLRTLWATITAKHEHSGMELTSVPYEYVWTQRAKTANPYIVTIDSLLDEWMANSSPQDSARIATALDSRVAGLDARTLIGVTFREVMKDLRNNDSDYIIHELEETIADNIYLTPNEWVSTAIVYGKHDKDVHIDPVFLTSAEKLIQVMEHELLHNALGTMGNVTRDEGMAEWLALYHTYKMTGKDLFDPNHLYADHVMNCMIINGTAISADGYELFEPEFYRKYADKIKHDGGVKKEDQNECFKAMLKIIKEHPKEGIHPHVLMALLGAFTPEYSEWWQMDHTPGMVAYYRQLYDSYHESDLFQIIQNYRKEHKNNTELAEVIVKHINSNPQKYFKPWISHRGSLAASKTTLYDEWHEWETSMRRLFLAIIAPLWFMVFTLWLYIWLYDNALKKINDTKEKRFQKTMLLANLHPDKTIQQFAETIAWVVDDMLYNKRKGKTAKEVWKLFLTGLTIFGLNFWLHRFLLKDYGIDPLIGDALGSQGFIFINTLYAIYQTAQLWILDNKVWRRDKIDGEIAQVLSSATTITDINKQSITEKTQLRKFLTRIPDAKPLKLTKKETKNRLIHSWLPSFFEPEPIEWEAKVVYFSHVKTLLEAQQRNHVVCVEVEKPKDFRRVNEVCSVLEDISKINKISITLHIICKNTPLDTLHFPSNGYDQIITSLQSMRQIVARGPIYLSTLPNKFIETNHNIMAPILCVNCGYELRRELTKLSGMSPAQGRVWDESSVEWRTLWSSFSEFEKGRTAKRENALYGSNRREFMVKRNIARYNLKNKKDEW